MPAFLDAGTAFINIVPRMAGFMPAVGKGMTALSGHMTRIGASMTKKLTLPILGIGVAAAKMASDFETPMQHMVGLVGISQKQIDAWKGDILDMARTLPQAPKELAEAMFFVTSAGFRGSEALDVLEASAKAAASGLGDTMSVADAVTSAVNAYGAETLSAADATDILTATVKEGKIEASAVAPVLGQILPTASELGVSFRDIGAAMAAMTRTGDNAANAATKINSIMSSLTKTQGRQEETMEKYGFTAEGLRESLAEKGLLGTLMDIREATGGNIAEMAKFFPNVRALRGALSLTGKQAETNVGIFDRMQDTTNLSNQALKAVSDTAEFKTKAALSSLQATAIEFGDLLLPIVGDLANMFGKLFDWIGKLPEPTKKLIIKVALLVAAAGPLLWIGGKLIGVFIKIFKWLGLLVKGAWLMAKGVAAAFTFLMAHPIVALIAAVVALVVLIIFNWGLIKRWTIKIWNAILGWLKRWWPLLLGIVTGGLGLVVGLFIKHWGAIKRFFVRIWDGIKGAFIAAYNWVKEKIGAVGEKIKTAWMNIWTAVSGFFANVWEGIKRIAANAINWIINRINDVIWGINTLAETAANIVSLGIIDVPDIPTIDPIGLHRGGVVRRPTLALIGERGPEAVVPLSQYGKGNKISGELTLTPDGRAFIRGIVVQEFEDENAFRRARRRA